jgi:hypothetical protein
MGEENKSPQGQARLYVENGFARAALARALLVYQGGTVPPASLRQGPGWAEACTVQENGLPVWRRYTEKNGRVYLVLIFVGGGKYEDFHAQVEALLDTTTVPGDFAGPAMLEGFTARKGGEFDGFSDADADREAVVKKTFGFLAAGREAIAKALPGKPFDASRPAAWLFQNGQKFEDRAKASLGSAPERTVFNSVDRCAMVSLLSASRDGFDNDVYHTAAAQYVWQYFGGNAPIWCEYGLAVYGQLVALGGGKGKLTPETLSAAKGAVAAGKRRLDQWFDVLNWSEVTDNTQGQNELFAWHWYFRNGKGAKKYKKQYEGYITSLRETGDPAVARKAFDGVNFDEMLQDFKTWAVDWK